jgi:ABC-2 type transport system ATP-binding protein
LKPLLKIEIKRAGYISEKDAIKDINFSLKEGELAGLIGPNGAGKSTTIKAILELLPIMDGRINFCGNNKRYAYIPEQPIFYDELTLWEHLELAASAHSINQTVFQERLLKADIYIVDEPFMGLDPQAIRDFLILLNQERNRGAGVLM